MRDYFGGDDFFKFMMWKEIIEDLEKKAFKKGKEDKDEDPEDAYRKAYTALQKKRLKESKRFSTLELGLILIFISPFLGTAQVAFVYKPLWHLLTH